MSSYIINWSYENTTYVKRAKSLAHLLRILSREKNIDIVATPRSWGFQMYENHTENWLGDIS